MNTAWSQVPLGELLVRSNETISPESNTEYPEITVKLWGRGVILRGMVTGAEIAAQRRFIARQGQFILSRIDARNGALGIVPPALDGAIVSNDFPVFRIAEVRLLPAYLGWMCRTASFVDECKRASEGTTNRVRLQEEKLLSRLIPLPSLPEQRRIVARIDDIASQIQEAHRLRTEAAREAASLPVEWAGEIYSRIAKAHPPRPFGSFSPHVTSGPRNWAKHYDANGLRFYRAQDIGPRGQVLNDSKIFIAPPPGAQGRSALLQEGDLMLVITGATVGRVSVFKEGLEPGFVSQHVAICRLPQNEVVSEYAVWGLRSPSGQSQLLGQRYGQGKPGLNLSNIRSLSLPFPDVSEQRRIVSELEAFETEVDKLMAQQSESEAELDALLPSVLGRAFAGELVA
jgi:type I restriction enzyme S subunit